ncbi:ATP-binding protein [Treponema sp. TIM-1]|uniref:ATP-binding protein n=1 Tax=Treponema sp. TIM-1 TaxID=2898417 RepID=UPI0039817CD2
MSEIQTGNAQETKSVLDYLITIVSKAEENGFTPGFFEEVKDEINYVSTFLKLSPVQTALFSLFLNRCDDNAITTKKIAKSIKCKKIELLRYMNELELLEKRKLIRCRRNDDSMPTYRVPQKAVDAIRKEEEYVPVNYNNLSESDFFDAIDDLFCQRTDNELTYDDLVNEVQDLLRGNKNMKLVQDLAESTFEITDIVLLLRFCNLFVSNNDDYIGICDIDNIFEDKSTLRYIERELKDGEHILMIHHVVQYALDDGLSEKDRFKLTDEFKDAYLSNVKTETKIRGKDFIISEKITPKYLFYNEKESLQVAELTALLGKENFSSVQDRLSKTGMRRGFACLFYGPPGTGKTETVYQIAKKTGRDIMKVDISQTKTCWYGESEKLIKKVFDQYSSAVKSNELTPILLFNEADGIIGKRHESPSRSLDDTENRIQNIILQEIENLEGILIATTNLTNNLDKAFERRFLYKIEFLKPLKAARKSIWKSMAPDLPEQEIVELASLYDFSGGQIENIVRKRTVDFILTGSNPSLEKMKFYCHEETLDKHQTSRIGFAV